MYKVIARTRMHTVSICVLLKDTSCDVLRVFPVKSDAEFYIRSLGFSMYEEGVGISYWHLPAKTIKHGKEEDVNLAGYIVHLKD